MKKEIINFLLFIFVVLAVFVASLFWGSEVGEKIDEIQILEPIPTLPETYTTCLEETTEETTTEKTTEETVDINSMDLWELGSYLYGISYLDTTRTLKIITFEGYGYSELSFYVACCCWVRLRENLWGYENIYAAFGEADTWNYGVWLDDIGIADYAYYYLRECYLNPVYCRYCNGMATPDNYLYYENGIYCWN